MICKKCGFEYVDGLKECPNCQEPNAPVETKVLTTIERDSFDGITIEEDGNEVRTEQEQREQAGYQEQGEERQRPFVKVHTMGGGSFLLTALVILALLAVLFFVLSPMLVIGLLAVVGYGVYNWLFN